MILYVIGSDVSVRKTFHHQLQTSKHYKTFLHGHSLVRHKPSDESDRSSGVRMYERIPTSSLILRVIIAGPSDSLTI